MSKVKSIAPKQVDCADMEADESLAPLCENCGYNLTGLTGNICPECGWAFVPGMHQRSRIPWAQRRAIGVQKAYWLTLWNILLRPAFIARSAGDNASRA